VQERATADEERARRLELAVQALEQRDAPARGVRIERMEVLRDVRAEEAGQALADGSRFRVVADQQRRDGTGSPCSCTVMIL
jgi:hypothetical protein